jgi:AcrR family transcriptional regulator
VSTYRQQQAAATRLRVIGAARSVFASRGYRAATIAGVAQAAGVAVPTIYKIFGSKRNLFSAVIDEWRRGFVPESIDEIPSDPHRALAHWAEVIRRQWETGLDIAAIYRSTAATEPHVQAELTARLAQREQWVRQVAKQIGPYLEPGVTVDEAAAVLSALAMPEIYRELVVTRGWTPDAFEQWLGKTLARLLLAL